MPIKKAVSAYCKKDTQFPNGASKSLQMSALSWSHLVNIHTLIKPLILTWKKQHPSEAFFGGQKPLLPPNAGHSWKP